MIKRNSGFVTVLFLCYYIKYLLNNQKRKRKFMLRFYYAIARNIFILPGIIRKMRQIAASDKYSEEERYKYLQYMVGVMQKTGAIHTKVYGEENLPQEGGYVMYPNHQGKYDAFGIVSVHEKPCTVVMDKAKSYTIFIREIIDMVKGKRLDKEDVKQAFVLMNEVAEEVKQGRHYILFPEGGYDREKKNTLTEFKSGCFKTSVKSKTPIVPVVLIDSYKAFNSSRIGTVTTQVHFLKSIPYEEYKGLKTNQIATMVHDRIQDKLDEIITEEGLYKVNCRTPD